jgi:CcmD family protein
MTYLMAAYIAIWLVLFVYLFSLNSRQRQLQKEVEALERKVTSDQ